MRRDVLAQEPPIQLDRAWTQTRTLRDPVLRVVAERDLGPLRVRPVTGDDDAFDLGQPPVGVRLALEPVWGEVPPSIRPEVARLELAERGPADAPEPPLAFLAVRHVRPPLACVAGQKPW